MCLVQKKKTSYGKYIAIRDEIQRALSVIRNKYCVEKWDRTYEMIEKLALNKEDKNSIQFEAMKREFLLLYPFRILETMAKD